jgi:hypothetical protein
MRYQIFLLDKIKNPIMIRPLCEHVSDLDIDGHQLKCLVLSSI